MLPNRLTIPDARGRGASLRVTRHSEQRKIVVSHWRDGLCVASTPIELSEVPALIGVLADALGDAVDTSRRIPVAPSQKASLLSAVRGWLRPKLAHTSLSFARCESLMSARLAQPKMTPSSKGTEPSQTRTLSDVRV